VGAFTCATKTSARGSAPERREVGTADRHMEVVQDAAAMGSQGSVPRPAAANWSSPLQSTGRWSSRPHQAQPPATQR
jgi:hypothetical protein